MSLGKPVIKLCLMEDEMRDFAISEAQKALDTSNSEKVIQIFSQTLKFSTKLILIVFIASCILYEINFRKEIQICLALYRW